MDEQHRFALEPEEISVDETGAVVIKNTDFAEAVAQLKQSLTNEPEKWGIDFHCADINNKCS